MAWTRATFRDSEVIAACGPDGGFSANPDGFVPFVYRPGGKQYKTRPDNLTRLTGSAVVDDVHQFGAESREGQGKRSATRSRPKAGRAAIQAGTYTDVRADETTYQVWTDGACSGNPGPAGLGVVVVFQGEMSEAYEFLGTGTNNVAELTAILRGLEMVKKRGAAALKGPVDVVTDSSYCIGLLTKGWKAKKNQALVESLRACVAEFADLRLLKVPGHAGVPLNERADALARQAIAEGV